MKYNLDDLHWQEFEILAYHILQILIAPGVRYFKGGNDKGRDVTYKGTSAYNPGYKGDWIFQVKHKSKDLEHKDLAATLSADLRKELTKVFITNKLSFDNYFLVTNKEINANISDALFGLFTAFKKTHNIQCANFDIIDYQAISACIDSAEKLKWRYPNIISHPDFEILIQNALNINLENRRKGWLLGIQKQREKFVHTQFFERASEKLSTYPAIILSGPPKSGKTFNAEILALNLNIYQGFQPVLIETIDDIEFGYKKDAKQVYIFDDAFGKYSLSFESREWSSRLERLFELADDSHLFIFTSREYVFRQFINYGNEAARDLLLKIIVESHGYSKEEKLSLLGRYTKLSALSAVDKNLIVDHEDSLTDHKNFSPETIRAFFYGFNFNERFSAVANLISHLDKPDSYLATVFFNLSPIKQAILLSVLCGVSNTMEILKRTFAQICNDLELNTLSDTNMEFDELDDSILKITKSDSIESAKYYHPSMQEFLIRQMVNDDSGKLKNIVLMNVNTNLLQLSHMKMGGVSIVTKVYERDICLGRYDLDSLTIGMSRLVNNRDSSLHQITEAIDWFSLSQHTVDLRINDTLFFKDAGKLLRTLGQNIFNEEFVLRHRGEDASSWSKLLRGLKNAHNLYPGNDFSTDLNPFLQFLVGKRSDPNFWMLAFRSLGFIPDDELRQVVGKDWLNSFYSILKRDIDNLGEEVYGDDYPEFEAYAESIAKHQPAEKVKFKPNNTWYPRFKTVEDRVDILKEVQGRQISKRILDRVLSRYDHVHTLKEYARNRHKFLVGKGWWAPSGNEIKSPD